MTWDGVGVASGQVPPAWVIGDVPEVDPVGAAWMLCGGGSEVPPEYQVTGGTPGYWLGDAATGLTWQVYRGDTDPHSYLDISGWTITARLLDAAGTFVADLTVTSISNVKRGITVASLGTGPLRAMIVELRARKPGATTDLLSHAVLAVAAS